MSATPSFAGLGLKKWLVSQCQNLGLKAPTPVQVNCIPAVLAGRDCIGCAKTGSGKTASFALPILDKLSDDPFGVFAVVLTPTRELAFQIKEQFTALGCHINTRVSVVVGGLDMLTQSVELSRSPHVIVATPGRLADHIQSGDGLKLDKVRFLVLDEADRLFEPCFGEHLGTIFQTLPKSRQTLLFSATLTDTIEQLQAAGDSPPHVYVAPADVATVETLEQQYLLVPEMLRTTALVHVLQHTVQEQTCIVFTHSCKSAQILTIGLKKLGFPCTGLHSALTQNTRLSSLAKFKSNIVKILVATDVASRGLDIPTVGYVVNHNTPSSPTDYLHRVGRTARAGVGGHAVTIITQYDIERLHAIEEKIGTQLTESSLPDTESVSLLQPVSLAMREALLHLDTHGFGDKRSRNKRKQERANHSTESRSRDQPPANHSTESRSRDQPPANHSTESSGNGKKRNKLSDIPLKDSGGSKKKVKKRKRDKSTDEPVKKKNLSQKPKLKT